MLIDSKTTDYNDAFVESMQCKLQKRPVIKNAFERTGSDIASINTVDDAFRKYSFAKEFPRNITNTSFASSKSMQRNKQTKFSSFVLIIKNT